LPRGLRLVAPTMARARARGSPARLLMLTLVLAPCYVVVHGYQSMVVTLDILPPDPGFDGPEAPSVAAAVAELRAAAGTANASLPVGGSNIAFDPVRRHPLPSPPCVQLVPLSSFALVFSMRPSPST
jgi:hypothetical protein